MHETKIRVAGLWVNTPRNGQGDAYLSGSLSTGAKLIAFKNTRKQDAKHPDWHLHIAEKPRQQQGNEQQQQGKPQIVRVGGLWVNTLPDGSKNLTGMFGSARLLVEKNTAKQQDKDPDYNVFITVKPDGDNNAASPAAPAGDVL